MGRTYEYVRSIVGNPCEEVQLRLRQTRIYQEHKRLRAFYILVNAHVRTTCIRVDTRTHRMRAWAKRESHLKLARKTQKINGEYIFFFPFFPSQKKFLR